MLTDKFDLSVIIPAYNEAGSLPNTISKLMDALNKQRSLSKIEIVVVDDGSKDDTLSVIKNIILKPSTRYSLHYLPLTRNFGKEAAVIAGYSMSKGELVSCLDADGQHPPVDLKNMIEILQKDSSIDMVVGVRATQNHKKIGFISTIFYKINALLGNEHLVVNGTDFRVMRRHVIETFLKFTERDRINRDLIDWLGFSYTSYPFAAEERISGKPTYSLGKLIKLAVDGLISSGTKPLTALLPFGFLITTGCLLMLFVAIVNEYLFQDTLGLNVSLQGYALIVTLLFFGIVMCALGIIALYLSRTYSEVRGRPMYVIDVGRQIR